MPKYLGNKKESTAGSKRPREQQHIPNATTTTIQPYSSSQPSSQRSVSFNLFNDSKRPHLDPMDDETDDDEEASSSDQHHNRVEYHHRNTSAAAGGTKSAVTNAMQNQPSSGFEPGLLTQMANVALFDAEIEFEESSVPAATVHSFSQSLDGAGTQGSQPHAFPTKLQRQVAAQAIVANKLKKFKEDHMLSLNPASPELAEKAFLRQFFVLGVGAANASYTDQLSSLFF